MPSDMGVEEGNVQVGAEHPLIAHQAQKGHGRRQLQQELLGSGEAGVLVVLYLLVVVDVADAAKDQRKQVDVQMLEIALQHPAPAADHDGHADTDDEHQAAHGGGALLRHMPLRADLLDALAGFQPYQRGDQQLTHHGGDNKADNGSENNFHVNDSLSYAPSAGRFLWFRASL